MDSTPPDKMKKNWEAWNLRSILIFSLFLQVFLIICAPHRKRMPDTWLIGLIWSAYFLADWTANFAIGSISSSQSDNTQSPGGINGDLLAFWLPFLLIHLGGPDTIISSSIEGNTLSVRAFFLLYVQVFVTGYVFLQSFPQHNLLMSKILLVVVGIIKYAERGYAIYLASLNCLKESMLKLKELDPGPNYSELEEYHSKREANIPVHTELTTSNKESMIITAMVKEGELESDIAVVQRAYRFFKRSRGLLIGLLFSFEERYQSRMFFHETTSAEAYNLIAVELNFIYESLFTKAFMVHSKMGYFLRTISFSTIVISLISFQKVEKDGFLRVDIWITYMLLYGAISLDIISLLKLIFSDWTVVALETYMQYSCVAFIFGKYLALKRSTWGSSRTTNSFLEWTRLQGLFQRWSESVTTFSFLDYSIKERTKTNPCIDHCYTLFKKIINMLLLKGVKDKAKFGYRHSLTEELWNFIFLELKRKSMLSDIQIGTRIYSARGDWILHDSRWNSDCSHLLSYVHDYDYDQSILLWHIATEICYNIDKSNVVRNGYRRGHCKTLSGYMLYLLILRPIAMSSVTGIFGEIVFRDTSAEAQLLFTKRGLLTGLELEEACKMILELDSSEVKPVDVKGNKSKSVLLNACALTKELMNLGEKKWDLMSEMWVELLSYAASHCEANTHADFLVEGGELVTFVWLLMAHLGIMKTTPVQTKEVDQPRANQVDEC